MYDNAEDGNRYLAGCIGYYNDEPVLIDQIRGDMIVRARKLPIDVHGNDNHIRFPLNDPGFNVTKFNLGYHNTPFGAVFIQRRPARIVQQGISAANLNYRGPDDNQQGPLPRGWMSDWLYKQSFADSLSGRYPTIGEAREMLNQNKQLRSVAFDRLFAIKRHDRFNNLYFLEYRGREIAHSQSEQFVLPREFDYLGEICTEKGVAERVA